MNTTIGPSHNNQHPRHTTARYIASIGAAAIALSALVGFSSSQTSPSELIIQAPARMAEASTQNVARDTALRIVLVASTEEKSRMERALDEATIAALGQAVPEVVVVVKGSALEQSLTSASGEVQSTGRNISVTDMTLPSLVATLTQPAIQQFGTAVDAEYAAQSLNPVAALLHPEAVQQQFGTAADAEHAVQSPR